jgi:hypothetical protein
MQPVAGHDGGGASSSQHCQGGARDRCSIRADPACWGGHRCGGGPGASPDGDLPGDSHFGTTGDSDHGLLCYTVQAALSRHWCAICHSRASPGEHGRDGRELYRLGVRRLERDVDRGQAGCTRQRRDHGFLHRQSPGGGSILGLSGRDLHCHGSWRSCRHRFRHVAVGPDRCHADGCRDRNPCAAATPSHLSLPADSFLPLVAAVLLGLSAVSMVARAPSRARPEAPLTRPRSRRRSGLRRAAARNLRGTSRVRLFIR